MHKLVLFLLILPLWCRAQLPEGHWIRATVAGSEELLCTADSVIFYPLGTDRSEVQRMKKVKQYFRPNGTFELLKMRTPNGRRYLMAHALPDPYLESQFGMTGNSLGTQYKNKRAAKKAIVPYEIEEFYYQWWDENRWASHQRFTPIDSLTRDTTKYLLRALISQKKFAHNMQKQGAGGMMWRYVQLELEYKTVAGIGFNPHYPTGRLWALIPNRFASDDEIMRLMGLYFDD